MTDEELLTTLTFKEVNEIRNQLQDKLEYCLFKNGLGVRVAKVQLANEKLHVNQTYPIDFRLTIMSLVGLDAFAIRRLTNALNEMRAEIENINTQYRGYKFIF